MAAAVKKTMAPVAVQDNRVAFGSLDFYVAGGGLPEGDYVWSNLQFQMYQAKNKAGASVGPERLGVMITMKSLTDPKMEDQSKFYSLGSNADKAYAPNTDDNGFSLVAKEGASAVRLNDSTNWSILLRSLYDAGMPEGIVTNSLEPLIGLWAHMGNVPEPEARKGFVSANATGEAGLEGQPQNARPNTIAVVMEIKEGGMPWDGGGGLGGVSAEQAKPAPAKQPVKAVAAAPKVNGPVAKAPPAPPTPPVSEMDEDDVRLQAINALANVIGKFPKGVNKTILRTQAFKALKDESEDLAAAVYNNFFQSDEGTASLLGELGYELTAQGMVRPVA